MSTQQQKQLNKSEKNKINIFLIFKFKIMQKSLLIHTKLLKIFLRLSGRVGTNLYVNDDLRWTKNTVQNSTAVNTKENTYTPETSVKSGSCKLN